MSYRLRTHEDLATGIHRIAREQLEGALCEIAAVTAGDEAAAVHATRKYIKKTRALLRLIREEIRPGDFWGRNPLFARSGRRLLRAARCLGAQLLEKLCAQNGT